MSSKAELRRRFRDLRRSLSSTQIEADSEAIQGHVLALPELVAAQSVFVYASSGNEVQTFGLIEDLLAAGKTVAVPRIVDAEAGGMEAVVIRTLDDLTPGPYDIPAPQGEHLLDGPSDLALVPGLAFSPDTGVRLGMGGGYYDRYFAAFPGPTFRVGLAFAQQLCADLPAEPHDAAVHAVVTPGGVRRVASPSP